MRIQDLTPVRPVELTSLHAARAVEPVEEVKDVVSVSKGGTTLARVSELAAAKPEAFKSLMADGAREVEEAGKDGRFEETRAKQLAAGLAGSAATGDAEPLRVALEATSGSNEQAKVVKELAARGEGAFGFRPAPFGPWFPRDKPPV